MVLNTFLNNARTREKLEHPLKQTTIEACLCFIFGALAGAMSKYCDTIPSNGTPVMMFFHFIAVVTTGLGIWAVLATLIAAWSRSPKIAVLRVFTFFAGMLIAYYLYSQVLFGFFPRYYFMRWGGIALLSSLAAYLIWFSRGKGWFAAFCAALPVGFLLQQGYRFFYIFSGELGFDILAAILLLVLLPKGKIQCLKAAPIALLIAFILNNSHILSYFLGGL